jgi:hypothetical protein
MVALTQALQGLSSSQAQFDVAAGQIARSPLADQGKVAPQDQVDLSTALVALLQSRNSVEANLKVLKTADEMEKKLLDVVG